MGKVMHAHVWHLQSPFWITWKKGDVTEIRSEGCAVLESYAGSIWRKGVFPETSSLLCLRRYRMAESALTFARRAKQLKKKIYVIKDYYQLYS